MANSTIFDVELHLHSPDSEILEELPSVFNNTNGELLDNFSSFDLARDSNENSVRSLDEYRHISSSPCKTAYPPTPRCLWRKYGVENHESEDVQGHEGGIIRLHEMAVHGTHVDDRILPGFRYHVRILSNRQADRYQFGGRALHLLRVGQGYGKRLTFEDEYANISANFFWSDSHPNGYAFSISAVQPGDEFVLCHQKGRPFGRATIVAASRRQIEIDSKITDSKDIVKRVIVSTQISVRYTSEPHGIMSLRADEVMPVTGVAMVRKPAKSSRAVTWCIEEVEIPGHGECLLYKEED